MPAKDKEKLVLAEEFFRRRTDNHIVIIAESVLNRGLTLVGLAMKPEQLKHLPTKLSDKRQQKKIEYLTNLREGLKERNPKELAETMGLLPKEKK